VLLLLFVSILLASALEPMVGWLRDRLPLNRVGTILVVYLAFFLGKRFLVTVHAEESRAVSTVEEHITRSPELLDRGVERLMHAITDMSVDAYFPIVDQIDEFIDSLEQRVFVDFDQAALRDVFSVKRLVLQQRRHLAPQREVFNVLTNRPSTLLSPETQVYFRDVYDHVLRINDSLDTYRELLSSTLDSYLSQVSNRLNKITLGLSVAATMSLPFVVISGMWGMNFKHIPLQDYPHAFWWMFGIQFAVGLVLLGHPRPLVRPSAPYLGAFPRRVGRAGATSEGDHRVHRRGPENEPETSGARTRRAATSGGEPETGPA